MGRRTGVVAILAVLFALVGVSTASAWPGPTSLVASSKTSTSITYTFNHAAIPSGKTGIRRERIQFRAVGAATWTTQDTANGSGATTLTFTGLSPSTTYEAQVRSYFEPDGSTSDYAPTTPLQTTTNAPPVTCDKYAATTGLDTNAGTSGAPYKTVQKLVDNIPANGTGCLKAGTFTDGGSTYVARITRDDITLRNDPGAAVTVKGTFYVVNGADRVKVTDLTLDGRPTSGVAPSPQVMATDTEFRRNTITNPTDICAIVGNTGIYGRALRPVFDSNDFVDCGSDTQLDHGIYLEAVDDAVVTNNSFVRSAAYAVHMYPDAQGSLVADNVMDDNGGGVIFAGQGGFASSDNIVEDNTIINSNHKPGIESYYPSAVGTGNIARNNCLDNNASGDIFTGNGGFTTSGNTFGPC